MKSRMQRVGVTSKSVFYAIVIHIIAAALLLWNIDWPSHVVSSSKTKPAPVQASVVSEAEIEKQMEAIQRKEEAEKQKQLEAQRELEELLEKKKKEEQRLAEIKEQQEEEKKKADELARKKEQEQQELAKIKQQEEEQRRKEEAEAKAKAEAEKKRQEEAERQRKAEEERQRKAEEERKRREEEARQKELAEKRERERQLQEQLEQERLQRQVNSALAQYLPIIKQKVSRNWNRPASLRNNIEAHVTVRLSQSGEVISARIVKSSGNPVFDRSVENAVLKASPLPIPQERGVNEQFRNLKLIFKPEEMIS